MRVLPKPKWRWSSDFRTGLQKAMAKRDYQRVLAIVHEKVMEDVLAAMHGDGTDGLLHEAAKRGDVRGIGFLVLHADMALDQQCGCSDEKTPLHCAVEYHQIEAAQLLLALGARSDLRTRSGLTAVDVARATEDLRLMALF